MRFRAIHQFHSGSAVGDAVTNGMLLTQRLLRELDFESEVYVEHVSPELKSVLRSHKEYISRPDAALIVHLAAGVSPARSDRKMTPVASDLSSFARRASERVKGNTVSRQNVDDSSWHTVVRSRSPS